MIQCIVIADTNFYRSCSNTEIEALVALEVRAGVVPMASYLVCSELLPHAANDELPDGRSCRAAIRRLYHHCFETHLGSAVSRFVPDPHSLLALSIFQRPLPDQSVLADNFAAMVADIGLGRSPGFVPGLLEVLDIVARHRDRLESRFVTMLHDMRRQVGLDPSAASDFPEDQRPTARQFAQGPDLPLVAAGALVQNVAAECGKTLNEGEQFRLGAELLARIPTAIDFFVQVIANVLVDGASPARHANSLWDMHFVTLASEWLLFDGAPLLLVTGDKGMLQAAGRTGAEVRVLSPLGYRQRLEAMMEV